MYYVVYICMRAIQTKLAPLKSRKDAWEEDVKSTAMQLLQQRPREFFVGAHGLMLTGSLPHRAWGLCLTTSAPSLRAVPKRVSVE
jgi:hypothetical protein